jgi:hypothetical protein
VPTKQPLQLPDLPESSSGGHIGPLCFFLLPASLGPQSQSFFRRYGSILPTSLTYIVLRPEATNLGDLLRIWVRIAWKIITSLGFSRGDRSTPDTTKTAVLYGCDNPILLQQHSRAYAPYKEKRTLPGTSATISKFVCVTAFNTNVLISTGKVGNINPIPFRS